MATLISPRDFVQIRDAARLLGVSEGTLRNWDRSGKLHALRHPVNGYRMYRVADLRAIVVELSRSVSIGPEEDPGDQLALPLQGTALARAVTGKRQADVVESETSEALDRLHWSLSVALDPKHRPQRWNAPSSTVRREWRKYPQEAHVLDAAETRYRRLTPGEIAVLQGFTPGVVEVAGLSDRQRVAAVGDAVPPPLAGALLRGMESVWTWNRPTAVEICAGAGGLAEGAATIGLEHLLLIDHEDTCGDLLRASRPWQPERVVVGDVLGHDFSGLADRVGLLSGGPPCQPWSRSGLRRGSEDPRDLLGHLPKLVADIRPETFLFENVPGLASSENTEYLQDVVGRLRSPGRGLAYGVLVGRFNAADYGVPQVRHRLFIVGFRDSPGVLAHRCLDAAARTASHRDPASPGSGRSPWRTVADAIGTMPDPGGWKRWL